MATISTVTDTTMFQIKRWLGINENPDGDTLLKLGEAAEMRNWVITKNGALQIRPGTEMKRRFGTFTTSFSGTPIRGMWYGFLNGKNRFVVSAGGKVYDVDMEHVVDGSTFIDANHDGEYVATQLGGSVKTGVRVEFFPYQGKLYILDGQTYQSWDGDDTHSVSAVSGYVPTILTGCSPANGSGTTGEQINLLSNARKVLYTVPSGTVDLYFLEQPTSITGVKNKVTGDDISFSITWDSAQENYIVKITLSGTIPTTANGVEVAYSIASSEASFVGGMRFYEYFNGANDNRVFLYGDGSNTCIYSGITAEGNPTAEYFPAINEIQVGESNTPITGLIRHFSRLICYKTTSTYSISYNTITLEDGTVTAGFYLTPANREIGNESPGQVRLVQNNPLTLFKGSVYQWKSTSSSSGNLTFDERQAKVISDRIENTLKTFNFASAYCFDFNYDQQYYICDGSYVIVYNYESNTWYILTNLKVNCIVDINHSLYFGMEDGTIRLYTRNARADYRSDETWETFDGETPFADYLDVKLYETKYTVTVNGATTLNTCYIRKGYPYTTETGDDLISTGSSVLVDDGLDPIDAYWRSGSLSFDRDWKRKYSTMLWVGVLPESNSKFTVTAMTDRRSNYPEKQFMIGTIGFGAIDFNKFSFGNLLIVQLKRIKLKVKKYVFYRLIFESKSKINTATIVSTDIQVRYAGNAK